MTQPRAKLRPAMPVSFTPAQLDNVMTAARSLPVESRDAFLRLVADQLKIRDVDVVDAIDRALRYLNQAA
jgi:hypothetical protein